MDSGLAPKRARPGMTIGLNGEHATGRVGVRCLSILLGPNLLPQPPRYRVGRTGGVVAGGAEIGLTHGGDIDATKERREGCAQSLVLGAFRRDQYDRIIGRYRM